jgi:hypothetical protein
MTGIELAYSAAVLIQVRTGVPRRLLSGPIG